MNTHKIIAGFILAVGLSFVMILQVGCNLAEGGMAVTGFTTKDKSGNTIVSRYTLGPGFSRMTCTENSFCNYLRNLKLKADGAVVKYYNGDEKNKSGVYDAVVDMEIGTRDLQQCADAVMRLRAEYLFEQKRYDDIHFNFTNGFNAQYTKWMKGFRIQVNGNKVNWVKQAQPSVSYKEFRKYLDVVFSYAGTLSLSKELNSIRLSQMQSGDVFIQGGSPGHAVIVVDMMQNNKSGQKYFMLAQSYMPAQETQILLNPNGEEETVWYLLDTNENSIITPEWRFTKNDLKRFE